MKAKSHDNKLEWLGSTGLRALWHFRHGHIVQPIRILSNGPQRAPSSPNRSRHTVQSRRRPATTCPAMYIGRRIEHTAEKYQYIKQVISPQSMKFLSVIPAFGTYPGPDEMSEQRPMLKTSIRADHTHIKWRSLNASAEPSP